MFKFPDPSLNAVFENNLILLDSLLPKIMAEAIFKYYTSTLNSVKDIFNEISYENPMKYSFEHQHPFYQADSSGKCNSIKTSHNITGRIPSQCLSGAII